MTTSTLDQLLAQAQEAKEAPEDLEQQMALNQAKYFAVSKTYEKYAQELCWLVSPLKSLLPNIAEYEAYAAPHDGKIEGANLNQEMFYTKATKQLRIKNPGLIVLTQSERSKVEDDTPFTNLSDDEFSEYLDNCEALSFWWEKKPSANNLELAKSVIVHTVLEDDDLRSKVLQAATKEVDKLFQLNLSLMNWRKDI